MDKNKIAHVDYLNYSQGDAAAQKNFVQEFGDSLAYMGFAIVKNHGVTEDLREKLFEVSIKFLNCQKMSSENMKMNCCTVNEDISLKIKKVQRENRCQI